MNDETPAYYETLRRLDRAIRNMMVVNWVNIFIFHHEFYSIIYTVYSEVPSQNLPDS